MYGNLLMLLSKVNIQSLLEPFRYKTLRPSTILFHMMIDLKFGIEDVISKNQNLFLLHSNRRGRKYILLQTSYADFSYKTCIK